jgi:hypothetical protein
MGPASARSFSSGVGCGALGSFLSGVFAAAGLAGLYVAIAISHCGTKRISQGVEILTVPGLNRPKNEVIVLVPGGEWETAVGVVELRQVDVSGGTRSREDVSSGLERWSDAKSILLPSY